MPWSVRKINDNEYKLWNLDKEKYVNKTFKTRQSAINMKRNYENYYRKKKSK
jgi:hypothetical protein